MIRFSRPLITINENGAFFNEIFKSHLIESISERHMWGDNILEIKYKYRKRKRKLDPNLFEKEEIKKLKTWVNTST